jgi:hypothetical protein
MSRFLRVCLLFVSILAVPLVAFAQQEIPFPDGCGNPFIQDGVFSDFFEKAIQSSVIEAGTVDPAHVKLFAVNRIRKFLSEKYPNPAEGEAVDKHIRAQLCSFGRDKPSLNSSSPELHRHLATISSRLLTDVKKVAIELNAKEDERQRSIAKFEARYGLIERAERLAEPEAKSVIHR